MKSYKVLSLLLIILIMLSGCAHKSSTDKSNDKANAQHTSDNQNIESTENATETISKIDVYAGPGTDYVKLSAISSNDIKSTIKFEKEWIEVDYGNKRGYIRADDYSSADINKIPHVVYSVSQNVYPYPTLYYADISISLFDDVKVYSIPKASGNPLVVAEKQSVKILCSEKTSLRDYIQIEYTTDKGKRRGYCESVDLLSLDNPLLNYEEVKQNNACISYKGNKYYSSSGEATSLSNGWNKISENNVSKTKIDLLAGIVGVIAGNDVNEEAVEATQGKIELFSVKDRKYINANSEDSNAYKKFSIAEFLLGTTISFLENGVKSTSLDIRLDEYNGEKRIVIKTGTPIEYPKAGKKTTLSSLIVEKNNTALTLVESDKRADEMIKNMYPNLDESKNYSMSMTFSDDFEGNNYGYYIVIDNKTNVYAVPIIHQGTSFQIFSEDSFVCDAAWDLGSSMIKVDDDSRKIILDLLSDNGYEIEGYSHPKYLEDISIIDSDQYDDNEGDSFVDAIGKNQYTRGQVDIDGESHQHGIEGWIARWNYKAEKSWAYSVFDLNGKYHSISGTCKLINSYNTTDFNTTLDFYGDDKLIASYELSPESIPFDINIDVDNVKHLKIYFHDNGEYKGGTSFGLMDMILDKQNKIV